MVTGQHGGYRKPAHPAPVSGPGHLSKRTDTGPKQVMSAGPGSDLEYGEQKTQLDAQRAAPMAAAAPLPAPAPTAGPTGGAPAAGGGPEPVDPFSASARPGEPITHGVPIGPGADAPSLNIQPAGNQPDGYLTSLLGSLSPADMTGTLGRLYEIAKQRGV